MVAFHDVAGWTGAALLLAGFIWGLRNTEATRNPAYLLMNIAGALGIIINTYSVGAYPAMAFNIVWMLVAVVSLIKKLIKG